METVLKDRKQLRRLFTIACNSFDKADNQLSCVDKINKLKLIEEKALLMMACEEKFKQLLYSENTSDTEIEREVDESETYIDRWRSLKQNRWKYNVTLSLGEKERSIGLSNIEKKKSMSKVDVKVVLLGKEYSGKTSLVERFVYNQFNGENSYQNTIGAAFGAKKIEIDQEVLVLGLWDTAGSERYESIGRIYYRKSHAAVICYDLTDSHSFERAKFWVSELLKFEEKCLLYLCGTKKDLVNCDLKRRAVDYHSVTDYAYEIKAEVFETSSKTGEGVDELFYKIGEHFLQRKTLETDENKSGFGVFSMEVERKKECCL
ncbi:ras-related protein Rab-24 [Nephila pilipes]|uniref:Ras-related protein Rab-24 n=1 Tax=Nephila pilipes TaxID=299642 RepID=A0A8X6UDA7_NEPPI|nr:ras-related protein Rab-24 [Nephila pilipes]